MIYKNIDIMDHSSGRLHLLKHITGSTCQLFMLISASFVGTWATGATPWWYMATSGGMGILLSRISSQLDYWYNKATIKEELEKHALMMEELAMHVETSRIGSKVSK